jgi:hypothetical protein
VTLPIVSTVSYTKCLLLQVRHLSERNSLQNNEKIIPFTHRLPQALDGTSDWQKEDSSGSRKGSPTSTACMFKRPDLLNGTRALPSQSLTTITHGMTTSHWGWTWLIEWRLMNMWKGWTVLAWKCLFSCNYNIRKISFGH